MALFFNDYVLSIKNPDRSLRMSWFDPMTAKFHAPTGVSSGSSVRLKSPDTEHEWCVLLK